VWLHAVSVGEVNLVVRLVHLLQERLPSQKFVVSTTTTTGMGELERKLPAAVERIYFPLDFRKWVQRALEVVQPRAVVLVEAEIWPNFLWQCQARNTPVFLVNARISERSRARYERLSWVFRPLFNDLALACCPSETDAKRLAAVGVIPNRIAVVGNLKFDVDHRTPATLDVRALLDQIHVGAHRPILLGGSTHPGEELALGRTFCRLRQRFPGLFLITVPRHFERAADAIRDLEGLGLRVARRSQLNSATPEASLDPVPYDVLVVDSTGELQAFYEHATVVFIGKSLTASGGQNPIEPAILGRPILAGPNMQNFRVVMDEFTRANAIQRVDHESALESAVADLLADPERAHLLGQRAQQVVAAGAGALWRTADRLLEALEDGQNPATVTATDHIPHR
jgi:3-deoxy-D-manno-octulosonic-acid transferase